MFKCIYLTLFIDAFIQSHSQMKNSTALAIHSDEAILLMLHQKALALTGKMSLQTDKQIKQLTVCKLIDHADRV